MLMSNTELSRRRVFGVGIIVCGVVLLAVALIMGLEFPEYACEQNIRDLCILDQTHSKYNVWVQDQYRNRYNRLYYWEVTNKDGVLYNGEFPKFTQRGPYVYKEKREKVNVIFQWYGGRSIVSFYEWKKQAYDRILTQAECGPTCQESDEITVFNEKYFKEMSAFKSDVNLAWNRLPATLEACYKDMSLSATNNATIVYLALASINQGFAMDLSDPSCIGFMPFGQWLSLNDTQSKSAVLSVLASNFSTEDMSGLYNALMSSVLLGSEKHILTDNANKAFCDNLMGGYNLSTILSGFTILYNKTTGMLIIDQTLTLKCGLIHWLEKYRTLLSSSKHFQQETALNLSYIIQQYLCLKSDSGSCLTFPSSLSSDGIFAYTSAIVSYIYDHLLPFSLQKSVISLGDEIITTKKQNDLALGYVHVDNNSSSDPILIPGILENVHYEENVPKESKYVTLLNCYDQLNAQSNFLWHAYERLQYSTTTQFPNATEAQRKVDGLRENYPPLLDMKACEAHNVVRDNVTVFLPVFWRTMVYKRQQDCYCGIKGVRVNTFLFNESNMKTDNRFIFDDGLQDMSGTNGYLSWASLPHFLYANESMTSQYKFTPSVQFHLPNISIEPITGNVWGNSIKFQHNVGILPEYTEVSRSPNLMINVSNVPLPVYWMDQSFLYNSYGVEDHQNRVGTLMSAACGGLISLSIISTIIMLLGASIALLKCKGTKVTPATEQESGLPYGPIW